jgi:hypothetical protein
MFWNTIKSNECYASLDSAWSPCLMQISLLQLFKAFQKYLATTIFGQFYFITAIFWLFGVQKSHYERNVPKKA